MQICARGIRVTFRDKFKSKELKLYVIRSLLLNILTSWILLDFNKFEVLT
jgi:hypothetical protein